MRSSKAKASAFLLFSTASNLQEAKKIAQLLVKQKLAACVNIVPGLTSYFRWQGKLDQAKKYLLIIKTQKRQLKSVEAAIRKAHSYSVPEMIGFPITWGSKSYLDWLNKSAS